jgi:hypothetical protein
MQPDTERHTRAHPPSPSQQHASGHSYAVCGALSHFPDLFSLFFFSFFFFLSLSPFFPLCLCVFVCQALRIRWFCLYPNRHQEVWPRDLQKNLRVGHLGRREHTRRYEARTSRLLALALSHSRSRFSSNQWRMFRAPSRFAPSLVLIFSCCYFFFCVCALCSLQWVRIKASMAHKLAQWTCGVAIPLLLRRCNGSKREQY